MLEAEKALLSPSLRYWTKGSDTLVAETKRSIVPGALILVMVAAWCWAFLVSDPMSFWVAGGVSLVAAPIVLVSHLHHDKITISPTEVVYEKRRLSGSRSLTAQREVFRCVRVTEYVTLNESRLQFYNVELEFSGDGFPKILKVFEARDVGRARAVGQELCRMLSVELEMQQGI